MENQHAINGKLTISMAICNSYVVRITGGYMMITGTPCLLVSMRLVPEKTPMCYGLEHPFLLFGSGILGCPTLVVWVGMRTNKKVRRYWADVCLLPDLKRNRWKTGANRSVLTTTVSDSSI